LLDGKSYGMTTAGFVFSTIMGSKMAQAEGINLRSSRCKKVACKSSVR